MRTPRLRLLSAILAVALFFTLLPVSALAEGGGSTGVSHAATRSLNTDNKDDQGLTYTLNADRTATVANYDNHTPDGVIDIPDTVKKDNIDYTVTAIGYSAFGSLSTPINVSSVFIPATVLSIGDSAFIYCDALTTVTFAENSQLKSIERAAFWGSEHVHPRFKEIKIPDSVETIGNGAFYECRDLERIALPSALQTLSSVTFYNCTALSEVTFPASLKTIESSAFSGCRNLSEVKLPASLTAIQSSVFHLCINLKTVSYDGSLEQWSRITADNDVLGYSCPSLVMSDYTAQFILVKNDFLDPPPKTVTITKYTGTESTVILPSTINSWPVTKIGEDALKDNTTITSVTIPANVTEIGSNAFAGCTNLTSVNYEGDWSNLTIQSGNPAVQDAANAPLFDFAFTPDNTAVIVRYKGTAADVTIPSRYKGKPVTMIGTDAFLGLNITSVTIPDSVTVIRSRAFSDCRNLTNINIPSSITFIGNYAFSNCESLTSITIPSSVTSIEESAFSRCSKLSSISIPDSISSIPAMAFNSCTDLATVSIPNSVTSIGYRAFYNCSKLSTVDYGGSKTQWNNLNKVGGNDPLLNATLVCAKLEATFDPDNGESISTQTIDRGEMFTKPAAPSKENHTFAGWYNGDEKYDFSTVPTDDVTLTAKWKKNAPVLPDTYALNVSGAFVYVNGVDVTAPAGDTTLQLEKDASVRLVADPDRMPSGMVFDRWTILNGALNADDAEKFETGRTLEEFAFTMPAEPLSIEATPRMQEEEGSDTVSVIAGVALGTAATALVAWQAYDLGMSLYQEHWLPADFVMPKTRAELALLLWNTAGRPAPAAQPAFADITDPDTAQAAQWAMETGLMTPKSADLFKPEKSVTRWKAVRSWKRVTNQNP